MNIVLSIVFGIIFIRNHICQLKPRSSELTVTLKPDLFLKWNIENDLIIFKVSLKFNSLMFGISGKQSSYADVIVAWSNNDETGHFSQKNVLIENNTIVNTTLNNHSEWTFQNADELNGYGIITFYRPLRLSCTSDEKYSQFDITPGNMTVIFAADNSKNYSVLEGIKVYKKEVVLMEDNIEGVNCVPNIEEPKFNSTPTGYYSNQVDLIPGTYRFYWNFTETNIIGEIHVKTLGWVGFGLSPNGGMNNSDVVIGWITNDGVANFTDRFIDGRGLSVDKEQNWKLLDYWEKNDYTMFKFERNITLCQPDDRTIEVYVIIR